MKYLWLSAIVLTGASMMAAAEIRPPRGLVDPRVREVVYDKDEVIRLTGYVGYQTHLRLAQDERFVGVGAGDTAGLDITADGNDTWIKPKAELVRTNIDIKTTHRVYHFDYEVRKNPPKDRFEMVYSIEFRYPDDERQRGALAFANASVHDKLHAPARKRNLDYWYCGAPSMRPIEAYDDGSQTHIRFGAHAEFPAVFAENEDGSETLINFHIEPSNDEMVIERIARRFVLRRGQLVGCVENRQFTGGGERLKTGTTQKDVILKTRPTESEAQKHE